MGSVKSVKFRCRHCQKPMEAGAGLCGSRVSCPHCRQPVDVPLLNARVAAIDPPDDSAAPALSGIENVLCFVATLGGIVAGILGIVIMLDGRVIVGGAIIAAAVVCSFWAFVGLLLIRIARDVARIADRDL